MSSENEDAISASISTRSVNHDRLVLVLDTALAHVFMLMSWCSHLPLDRLYLRLCVCLCASENQPLERGVYSILAVAMSTKQLRSRVARKVRDR